jgi:hypothetical protein
MGRPCQGIQSRLLRSVTAPGQSLLPVSHCSQSAFEARHVLVMGSSATRAGELACQSIGYVPGFAHLLGAQPLLAAVHALAAGPDGQGSHEAAQDQERKAHPSGEGSWIDHGAFPPINFATDRSGNHMLIA